MAIPANARVGRFVPHGPLLDRAVCAITHDGMGATQKVLSRGVPVCAVPFGRDQLEVARRIEIANAGTRLPAKSLNPERLRRKVPEAMTKGRVPRESQRHSGGRESPQPRPTLSSRGYWGSHRVEGPGADERRSAVRPVIDS